MKFIQSGNLDSGKKNIIHATEDLIIAVIDNLYESNAQVGYFISDEIFPFH